MDERQPSLSITNTVLMLKSVTTVISHPPTCSILTDSAICKCFMPSAISRIMLSFIWESHFQQSDRSTFNFFNLTQNFMATIVRSKHTISCLHGDTLPGNMHYFHTITSLEFFVIANESDTTPLILPMTPKLNTSAILFFVWLLLALFILKMGTCN